MTFTDVLFISLIIQFFIFLALCKLSSGPEVKEKNSSLLNRLTMILYTVFLIISGFSIASAQRVLAWTYAWAVLVAVTSVCVLLSAKLQKNLLLLTLSLPTLIMATSLAINGLMPLTSDEGVYSMYAFTILKDGKWDPFKLPGVNPYYQFFPVISFIEVGVSQVSGLDILYGVHPLLVLCLTFLITLTIYSLVKKMLPGKKTLAVLAPLFFLSSPPISTLAFIPQNVSVAFYLIVAVFLMGSVDRATHKSDLISISLLSLIGVISHATFPLLFLTSMAVLMMIRASKLTKFPRIASGMLRIVSVITLAYWAFTYALHYMVGVGTSILYSFAEFFGGESKVFSSGEALYLYANAPQGLAFVWAFLPALAAVSIFLVVVSVRAKRSALELFSISLGFLGLLMLVAGFVLRSSHLMHRYMYTGYFLLFPASALVLEKIVSRRKVINIMAVALLMVIVVSYGIQDPAFSPDIYRITTDADKRSWLVANTLVSILSPNVTSGFDTRVGIAFGPLAVKDKPEYAPQLLRNTRQPELIIVNLDKIGKMSYKLWFGYESYEGLEKCNSSLIYSDGIYMAHLVKGHG
jgi:hypothetical protein